MKLAWRGAWVVLPVLVLGCGPSEADKIKAGIQAIVEDKAISDTEAVERLAKRFFRDFERRDLTVKDEGGKIRAAIGYRYAAFNALTYQQDVKAVESSLRALIASPLDSLIRFGSARGLDSVIVACDLPVVGVEGEKTRDIPVYRVRVDLADVKKFDGWNQSHEGADAGTRNAERVRRLQDAFQVEMNRFDTIRLELVKKK